MSSEAANSREARRRRIVDRGTDRLALITGRIQSLPDAAPPPPPPPSDADYQTPPASSDRNIKVEELPFAEPDSNHLEPQNSKIYKESVAEYIDPDLKPTTQSSDNTIPESSDRPQSSLEHLVSRTAPIPNPQTQKHRLVLPFTPRQISSSVTETESLRNFCSLVIASMVVLSYAGFPILRTSLIKKVIFFRPLVLLLLTNITIVVAPLLGEQQDGTERSARDSDEVSADCTSMAEQLGNVLEIGLLVQKVSGALFMDCSIYCVIVISGLSLFQ